MLARHRLPPFRFQTPTAEVYKLHQENGVWKIQPLQIWAAGDGPYAGVILDAAGNIYGTTMQGGSNGLGTVFELVAGRYTTVKNYRLKVLWNFGGPDGSTPISSLTLDGAGNLYGATAFGGSVGYGTIFEVTP